MAKQMIFCGVAVQAVGFGVVRCGSCSPLSLYPRQPHVLARNISTKRTQLWWGNRPVACRDALRGPLCDATALSGFIQEFHCYFSCSQGNLANRHIGLAGRNSCILHSSNCSFCYFGCVLCTFFSLVIVRLSRPNPSWQPRPWARGRGVRKSLVSTTQDCRSWSLIDAKADLPPSHRRCSC
jgi:hypothetical protein